jgi:PqqD family protein of HPr-rel-A system
VTACPLLAGVNTVRSWQAPPPHLVAVREWDDEFVVFNDATGDTHHLGTLAGTVLLALLDHPDGLSPSALEVEVARRVEIPHGVALDAEIRNVLDRLADWRLATAVFA